MTVVRLFRAARKTVVILRRFRHDCPSTSLRVKSHALTKRCTYHTRSKAHRYESANFLSPSSLSERACLLLCLRLGPSLLGRLAILWLARRRGRWDWRRYTFDKLPLFPAE